MSKRQNPSQALAALGSCPYNYGSEAVQPGPGFALKISLIERGRKGVAGFDRNSSLADRS